MLEISTARPQRAREHGAGTTWESVHHGGGGIGYSIHAGMVVVAGTTPDAGHRLQRVLITDPSCNTPMQATRRTKSRAEPRLILEQLVE